jgi:hypothetical protein
MKKLAIIVSLAALGGCATTYPGPANYGTRAYAQQPADPNGWQVVSVTPVPPGTGAAAAASGEAGRVTSEPIVVNPAPATTVVTQPVYVPTPVYAPAPVYADPFWYPPISIGLGFSWSNWGRGYHGGYHGGYRGGYRGPARGHR